MPVHTISSCHRIAIVAMSLTIGGIAAPARAEYDAVHGRFLQRDPAGYVDGMNLYEYVKSLPNGSTDPTGMWGVDVHSNLTAKWAREVGYTNRAAITIGGFDIGTDGGLIGSGTGFAPYGDQSRHFNRDSPGQQDSRLVWLEQELGEAKRLCREKDKPLEAAKRLGRALHSIQDWWAHGDYSAGPRDTFKAHSSKYDDPKYDAHPYDSADGRAPKVFENVTRHRQAFLGIPPATTTTYEEVRYRRWVPGNRRILGTEFDTLRKLRSFYYSVEEYGGCKCKDFFVKDGPWE